VRYMMLKKKVSVKVARRQKARRVYAARQREAEQLHVQYGPMRGGYYCWLHDSNGPIALNGPWPTLKTAAQAAILLAKKNGGLRVMRAMEERK
jgi:hypothetical protein